MSKNKQCASCSYIAQDENREGWCELHQTSTTVTEWCPDYHQKKTRKKPPVIRLTKKQKADLDSLLKGMTLAGAMALAVKDEAKFQALCDRQQAITHALKVLGIEMEAGDV